MNTGFKEFSYQWFTRKSLIEESQALFLLDSVRLSQDLLYLIELLHILVKLLI